MSNPFAKFAAGGKALPPAKSAGEGWLSTKKVGRDDAQIQKAKRNALDFRRSRIARKRGDHGGKKSKEPKKKSSKDDYYDSDELDDEDEIVYEDEESEDEVEEFFDEEEEDEDEHLVPFGDDSVKSQNDSIEDSSPEPTMKRKRRTGRAAMRSSGNISTSLLSDESSLSDFDKKIPQKRKLVKKPKEITFSSRQGKESCLSLLPDSDSAKQPPKPQILSLSDEEEDFISSQQLFSKRQLLAQNKGRQTKNNTKEEAHILLSSDEEDVTTALPHHKINLSQSEITSKRSITSPFFSKNIVQQTKKLVESEDDWTPRKQKPNQHISEPNYLLSNTDSENDEKGDDLDEAIALSHAIELSRIEAGAVKNQCSAEVFGQKVVIQEKSVTKDELDDTDDDEDGEETLHQDEFKVGDEDEREASSVLDAANNLSAFIVQVLQNWCHEEGGDQVTQGVIIDGALSLSTICPRNSVKEEEKKMEVNVMGGTDSKWITQEEMRTVCPALKLSDYQLIGVNWMALLHRLRFDVNNNNYTNKKGFKKRQSRKETNVNGVLADEMGLGKTVQTIAFLAWLKSKENGDCIDVDTNDKYDIDRPHIIVVPASVLSNWEREFKTFCPAMRVMK